jgi:hypothetical protein
MAPIPRLLKFPARNPEHLLTFWYSLQNGGDHDTLSDNMLAKKGGGRMSAAMIKLIASSGCDRA